MAWRQRIYALMPWRVREWLVAAEALRQNYYRRYGDTEALRQAYAFERYAALTLAELRAWQLQRLQALVGFARTHCSFYANRLPEQVRSLGDLACIAVLTKADVRENYARLLARDAARQGLWRSVTSGSTGTPVHFAIGRDGVRIRFAVMDAYYALYGCRYGDRRVRLGGQWIAPASATRPPFWIYNRVYNQLHMSVYHMDDRTLPLYVEKLNEFQPLYITGFGHSLYVLGRYLAEHGGLAFAPRAVFTDAETLQAEQREFIERGFRAPSRDVYGLRETNWVAVHCSQHRYHALSLTSILEAVDPEGRPVRAGQVGRLVVTDLTQQAFPFIRYDTGDLGAVSEEECTCGWHSPLLESLEGRAADYVVTPRGRQVAIGLVAIARAGQHIVESQLVQTAADRLLIRLVPAEGFCDADAQPMVAAAHDLLGDDMHVTWEAVPAIDRAGRLKFRYVVRQFG
jgi:phenylacetate-CoA ligase